MLTTVVSLGNTLTFLNGRAPVLKEDGEYTVFGSNGPLGRSDEFNHESAIILGRVGAYCGSVAISEERFWASDNTIVVKPKLNHSLRYWYYRLVTLPLRGFAGGAAQPLLTHGILKGIKAVIHDDPNQQCRIADILSGYDDLIENNRRRMALLEEAARQLYREWFIRLRFPGHEHTRITNAVPEGWEKITTISAMDVLSGGTPKTNVSDYWDGDIPFYTPKDGTEACFVLETERNITDLGLKNCNSRLYQPETVFISARGTVGKLNLASRPMAMSQSCYALRGKGHVSQLFLFCALKEAIEHFKQHAVGAVFDAIVVDTFKLIPFTVPDEKMVRLFEGTVTPVFGQIANLMEQNQKLRAARDLLLPRLMSGELVP